MLALCITVLALCDLAFAFSSGLNTDCDAHALAGCTEWFQGNRKNCTDPVKGFMTWVAKPVRSSTYSLRSGNGAPGTDPTSYTPGDEMSIFITVLKAGQQYRGLLMHAVNASGATVGTWRAPVNGNNDFWTPKTCPGAVLHKTAAVKPYSVEFRFRAPVDAGTITIRALIKQGPANVGNFYYPNLAGDLSLTAGGSSIVSPVYTGASSCEAVCGPGNVNNIALDAAASYRGFSDVITPKLGCVYPLLSSCVPITPFIDTSTGLCYFKESNCAPWRNLTQSSTAKHICPCGQPIASASTKASPFLFLAPLLLGLFNRKSVFALTLLLLVQHSFAHNWIHTPSRASFQASTIPPCQMRKDVDTHAQVGPGQAFQFKWAMGHDGWPARIVLLRGEDVELLDDENIEEIVDTYIAEALAAGQPNLAFAPETMRYHGVGENAGDTPGVLWEQSVLNGGVVAESDPLYINHTRVPTIKLWKYKSASIPDDVRVEFASAKYPWILSAARFPHEIDTPSEWDAIHVKMPTYAKAGHHVLYWRWQGYTDCTDVDYFSTAVTYIYGQQTPGSVWSKIDHCQYVINEFPWCQNCDSGSCSSPILECPATPATAMDDFSWTGEEYRVGVQATPAVMPSTIAPAVRGPLHTGIPWWEESCTGTSWTNLTVTSVGTNYIQFSQPEPIGQVQLSGLVGWPEMYLNHTYFVSNATSGGVSCGSPQMPGTNRCGESAVVWCAGIVGSYVLRVTSAGEGSGTVDMSKVKVERAYPAGLTENTMVCYTVNVRQTTPVASEYVVSLDPGDPVFYSTCYTRELNITWLAPPPPPPQPPRWHFNGQCLDCGYFEQNKWIDEHPYFLPEYQPKPLQFTRIPRWKMAPADKCIDCDREKQPATKPFYESYYLQYNATANEGFQCSSTGSTCGANFECLKEVVINGRNENGQNKAWLSTTEWDCLGYAANDPECGSEVMVDFTSIYGFAGCTCWKKAACCGSCRVEAKDWDFSDRLYTTKNPTPDPTCANGVKSSSGKLCCPAECQVGGMNYCGHTDCLNYGGTCCDHPGLASECSEHGAPCKLSLL